MYSGPSTSREVREKLANCEVPNEIERTKQIEQSIKHSKNKKCVEQGKPSKDEKREEKKTREEIAKNKKKGKLEKRREKEKCQKSSEQSSELDSETDRFDTTVADRIIKDVVNRLIGDADYNPRLAKIWAKDIVDEIVRMLTANGKDSHKYVVSSVILERAKAHLHLASGCYWENDFDGSCTVRWENATTHCVVSVYGLLY